MVRGESSEEERVWRTGDRFRLLKLLEVVEGGRFDERFDEKFDERFDFYAMQRG